MAERTIDLRKPSVPAIPLIKSGVAEPKAIEWSALEYEARERGSYWFLFPGIIALALVIFGAFTKNYFFIAFTVISFLLLGLFMRRSPRMISYVINEEGVRAGGSIYPFANIKSFWIFDKAGLKEISLEIKSMLSPFLRLPLGDTDPEKARSALLKYLPEEEHKELATDQIARSLGL